MSSRDQTFTSSCSEHLKLLWEVSRMDAQNFLRYRRMRNTSLLSSLNVLVLVMLLWHDQIWYECLTHIFSKNYIGRLFGMQDSIKQWPIFSLLPMCTADAGLNIDAIVYLWTNELSGIWTHLPCHLAWSWSLSNCANWDMCYNQHAVVFIMPSGVSFLYNADVMTSALFGTSQNCLLSFPATCIYLKQSIST